MAADAQSPLGFGTCVRLVGLNARSDLNGHYGVVKAADGDRFKVVLATTAEGVRVKPANLEHVRKEDPGGDVRPPDEVLAAMYTAWARGLSPQKKVCEWIVDCYRLRLEDVYRRTGDGFGLYKGGDPLQVIADFLLFCKLARARMVLPETLDWALLCEVAAEHLPHAFESADAWAKWGMDPGPHGAITGEGRSLTFTAELIYGRPAGQHGEGPLHQYLYDQLNDARRGGASHFGPAFDGGHPPPAAAEESDEEDGEESGFESDDSGPDEWGDLPASVFKGVGGERCWDELVQVLLFQMSARMSLDAARSHVNLPAKSRRR